MKCYWLGGLATLALFGLLSPGNALQDKKQDKKEEKKQAKKQEKKKPPVFTNAKEAGVELGMQGEFVGKVGDKQYGAQVVAKGNGNFEVYFLAGGLPGAGWDGKTRVMVKAKMVKDDKNVLGRATLEGGKWTGELFYRVSHHLKGKSDKGEDFYLTDVLRKSPTLGKKPPEGAVVLFDGKSADEWQGGKIVEGDLLQMGTNSKKTFKDFVLHIEFRTPFQPTAGGQGRGNSGVYLQGRYEIQVLDSFGLKGLNNECGGIYGQTAPLVNMCFPPLSWQTFDITYKAARFDDKGKETAAPRVTVLHNGVLIHDNVELKGKHSNQPGPINLQNHGNPVYYRNIWVVPGKEG